jgi:hypothetical protein
VQVKVEVVVGDELEVEVVEGRELVLVLGLEVVEVGKVVDDDGGVDWVVLGVEDVEGVEVPLVGEEPLERAKYAAAPATATTTTITTARTIVAMPFDDLCKSNCA